MVSHSATTSATTTLRVDVSTKPQRGLLRRRVGHVTFHSGVVVTLTMLVRWRRGRLTASLVLPAMVTDAPSCASSRAQARPMPAVIGARWSVNSV